MNSENSEVSSLADEETGYLFEYNMAAIRNDITIDMTKNFKIPDELMKVEGDYFLIEKLKFLFDKRRAILTELFCLTNNPNGVDILIEYCDHYLSVCLNLRHKDRPPILDEIGRRVLHTTYGLFVAMAQHGITEEMRRGFWNTLANNECISPISSRLRPSGSSNDHIIVWPLVKRNMCSTNESDAINVSPLAIVIMADSNLGAAIKAFIESNNTALYQVDRVLVLDSIKEQLLNLIRSEEVKIRMLSNLFVFHNTEEALGNLNGIYKVQAVSLWSENITAAIEFAENVQTDTIWINGLGQLDFGLHSVHNIFSERYFKLDDSVFTQSRHKKPSLIRGKVPKTYDHFYGGKWQSPVNGKYWTHKMTEDSIAEATEDDIMNCVFYARKAFEDWRSTKLSERVKVIRHFAERLRANGQFESADIVSKYLLHRPLDLGTSLSIVRDGEAEIFTTPEPVGVIAIGSNKQAVLFSQLTIASVTGNAVVVVPSRASYMSFAPYCDLLGTCGFPPGLISCMYTTHGLREIIEQFSQHFDRKLPESSKNSNRLFLNPYKHRTIENTLYNNTFISVTKPKSIWIPLK